MSVNEKMTAVADEIRVLMGGTEKMGLDAMADELGGANAAVTGALAAVTERGVTVPESANVESLAELIRQISGGDGGGVIVHRVQVTPESDSRSLVFSGLRGEPVMYSVEIDEEITQESIGAGKWYVENHISGGEIDSTQAVSVDPRYSMFSRSRFASGYLTAAYADGTFTITDAGLASYSMYFRAGRTYTLSYTVAAGAGIVVEEKDVNFYDYDGALLYSYTLEEAQMLTELPKAPMPPKDFLEFQEWNWTLEQIKSFGKMVDVGAVYKTVDGTTRLVVDVWDDVAKTVTLCIKSWNAGTTIDWGDGTSTSVGSDVQTAAHEYDSTGRYTVTLTLGSDGWNLDLGDVSTLGVMNNPTSQTAPALREAYLGENARCTPNAFGNCTLLETVTIPNSGTTRIWSSAFSRNRSLKACILPSSMKKLDAYVYSGCYSLRVVPVPFNFEEYGYSTFGSCLSMKRHICAPNAVVADEQHYDNGVLRTIVDPKGMTAIPSMYLSQCFCMVEYTVSETIVNIGASAFYNMLSAQKIRFLPTTPPTVSNANAFYNLPSSCVIEVPAGSLTAYREATNYGSIATQMVGV